MIKSHYIIHSTYADKHQLSLAQQEVDTLLKEMPFADEEDSVVLSNIIKGYSKSPKRFPMDVIATKNNQREDSILCAALLIYSYHSGNATMVTSNLSKDEWEKGIQLYEYFTERKFSPDLLFLN